MQTHATYRYYHALAQIRYGALGAHMPAVLLSCMPTPRASGVQCTLNAVVSSLPLVHQRYSLVSSLPLVHQRYEYRWCTNTPAYCAKRMGTCACQLCCCPACPHHVRRVFSALLMPWCPHYRWCTNGTRWCPHYRWCTNGTSTVGAPTHLPIVHRRPCPYLSCTCPYLSCTCLSTTN